MTWFVASIISYIDVIDESQLEFPIYEDFYLFHANTESELDDKIKERIQLINSVGLSGISLNGKPAIQKCAGVRKIRSVYNEQPLDIDQDCPNNGTELSHSFFIATSIDEVFLLAKGKRVKVLYVDDD